MTPFAINYSNSYYSILTSAVRRRMKFKLSQKTQKSGGASKRTGIQLPKVFTMTSWLISSFSLKSSRSMKNGDEGPEKKKIVFLIISADG